MVLLHLLGLITYLRGVSAYDQHEYPLRYANAKMVDVYIGKLETNTPLMFYPPLDLSTCDFFGLKEKKLGHLDSNMGSELRGDIWVYSPRMRLVFNKNIENENLCIMPLLGDTLKNLKRQINDGLKITYLIDGLPTSSYIGLQMDGKYYVFTHRRLDILVSDDRIIKVEITPSHAQLLDSGSTLEFTYEVQYNNIEQANLDERYGSIISDMSLYTTVDDMYLVSAYGFSVLTVLFAAAIFSVLFDASEKSNSKWALVPENIQKIFIIQPNFFVKPDNTILLSVVFTFGIQILFTCIVFTMLWQFCSATTIAKAQISGSFIASFIRTLLMSYFPGGLFGGAFMKFWNVRRYRRATLLQFFLPIILSGIVATQMRSSAVVARTTMAWPLKTLGKLILCTMMVFVLYLAGFFTGHKYGPEFQCTVEKDIVPEKVTKKLRYLLMAVNILAIAISFFSGMYQSYLYINCIFVEPLCLTSGMGQIVKHVLPGICIYLAMVVLICFLSLCIGYTKWQKNCIKLGLIWFCLQLFLYLRWFILDAKIKNLYTFMWLGGISGIIAGACGAAASTAAYITNWATLRVTFDERKSE